MKFSQCALLMAATALHQLASAAFVPNALASRWQQPTITLGTKSSSMIQPSTGSYPTAIAAAATTTQLKMESDFASAMPDAPQLTKRELLEQAADKTIGYVQGSLADDVEAVPELAALQKVRDDASSTDEQISLAIYSLMIERGMTYDEDPDNGMLTPTDFDIQANLEVPEVKAEFKYLYKYGMSLISKRLASVDGIKAVVEKQLIARTGKTPEDFDAWLGF